MQRARVWGGKPNASLVFLRFMPHHHSRDDARLLGWFADAASSCVLPSKFLGALTRRREGLLPAARHLELLTLYRLAVGLANPAPVENSGTSWNPTYGVPAIPGSSPKGITRNYLEEEIPADQGATSMGALEALPTGPGDWSGLVDACGGGAVPVAALARLLFGDSGGEGNEGALVFFDAWPTAQQDRWFEVDVVTSHHLAYYGDGAPVASDTDEPNPVHFLCIRPGVRFDLAIAPSRFGRTLDPAVQKQALDLGLQLLEAALERWGVGAKTGAGYGRLARKIQANAPKARPKPPASQVQAVAGGPATPARASTQARPAPTQAPIDVDALVADLAAAAAQGLEKFKSEVNKKENTLRQLTSQQASALIAAFLRALGGPVQGARARMVSTLRAALLRRTP